MNIWSIIYYSFFIWVSIGIFAMLIDYIRGWPKLFRNKEVIFDYIEHIKTNYPDEDPKKDICIVVLATHIIWGPVSFLI